MSEPRFDPPPPDPEWRTQVEHGRVLAFAPHPDDEAAGPGGVLCLHRRQGDPVRVVIATDGVAGDPDHRYEPSTYVQLRRAESRAGTAELGVDDLVFWGFPDSCQLSSTDLEWGAQRAADELRAYDATIVYLPWRLEGHPDHHALHVAVMRGLERSGSTARAYGYEVWQAMVPDLIVDITPVIAAKQRAMACYHSQLAYVRFDHCTLGLNAHRSLIHARGQGYGEAFQRLR